jgi:hypothetical protein
LPDKEREKFVLAPSRGVGKSLEQPTFEPRRLRRHISSESREYLVILEQNREGTFMRDVSAAGSL